MAKQKVIGMQKRKINERIFYWCILVLPLIQFCIFYIGVNFNSIILSMQEITQNPSGEGYIYSWVGIKNIFQNAKFLFTEYEFLQSWKNSAVAYLAGLIFGTGFSLLFSYYIYKKHIFAGVFKVMLFLPSIISSVALVIIFSFFAEDGYPFMMKELFNVQVTGGLLGDANKTFGTILFYTIWISFGGSVLMYLGAMNSISESVVEAAMLDGITPLKEFIYITFPLIYPTFVTFFVTGLAGFFTNQMNLYTFKESQVSLEHYTFGYWLFYNTSRGFTYYPKVASYGVLFTLIIAPITFAVRWLLEKFGPSVE